MFLILALIGFFVYLHYTNPPRNVLLNNPFALALAGEYVHHRSPPPPPRAQQNTIRAGSGSLVLPRENAPPRPAIPPPSYEDVAGPRSTSGEYPQEKRAPRHQPPPPIRSRERRLLALSIEGRRPSRSHHERERRALDREHRDRDRERRKHKKRSPKKPEPVKLKNLDTIDKLDVTAFFGGGFHHDGPFDACTPHRNKSTKKLAPVAAFPVDGPNNSLLGFTLANKINEQKFNMTFGNYNDDDHQTIGRQALTRDIGRLRLADAVPVIKTNVAGSEVDPPSLNPKVVAFDLTGKGEQVHGLTTAGLGSLTFIDGAPAPRLAQDGPLLGRKKLIVHRLRKNSLVEDTLRSSDEEERGTNSLIRRVKSLKVRR